VFIVSSLKILTRFQYNPFQNLWERKTKKHKQAPSTTEQAQKKTIESIMEDVPLEKQNLNGETHPQVSKVSVAENQEHEDEDDMNHIIDELKSSEESQASQVLVDKLKQSTVKLTSALSTVATDVDLKLDHKISSTAHSVDQSLGVSNIVSGTWKTLNQVWSDKVKPATRNIVENDRVKGVTSIVGGTIEKSGVPTTLKSIEKEHQLTAKAVNVVASSMDWVADTITSRTSREQMGGNSSSHQNPDTNNDERL
jgi:hypothetical protein